MKAIILDLAGQVTRTDPHSHRQKEYNLYIDGYAKDGYTKICSLPVLCCSSRQSGIFFIVARSKMEKTKHIISKADEDLDRNENSTLLHLQAKFSSLQKHRAVESQIWLMKEDCATFNCTGGE